MTTTTQSIFQASYQKTEDWLRILRHLGGYQDEAQAYSALRAVLHALRDRLTVEEAAQLAAQLPTPIRGVYYDGWKPAATPVKLRQKEEFFDTVAAELRNRTVAIELEPAVRSVFELLSQKVTAGEIEDVKGLLPAPIRELWPE